jgi:hypothetical protein
MVWNNSNIHWKVRVPFFEAKSELAYVFPRNIFFPRYKMSVVNSDQSIMASSQSTLGESILYAHHFRVTHSIKGHLVCVVYAVCANVAIMRSIERD